MKHKKIKIVAAILVVLLIAVLGFGLIRNNDTAELRTIKSAKQLKKIYEGENTSGLQELLINILAMPFSILGDTWDFSYSYSYSYPVTDQIGTITNSTIGADSILSNIESSSSLNADTSSTTSSSTS